MGDHHHFHLIHFTLNKQLSEMYLFIFISSLAFSMIGIFIPLYLLSELQYSFINVLLFYILYFFIFAIFAPFSAKLCSKIGFKHTILLSMPLLIGFFGLLYSIKTHANLFYLAAIIFGVSRSLYWLPFHSNFTKFTDRKHRGEEIGIWYSLATIIGIIGPLVGALILTYVGFSWLFLIVTGLSFVSVIPLFYSKEVYGKYNFRLKGLKESGKDALAFIGYGVKYTAHGIFWPVFIFLMIGNYLKLGGIISCAALFTAFFSWFIGRYSDINSKSEMLKSGSLIESIIWIVRIFARTFKHFLGLSILGMMSFTMIDIPFMAKVYNKAQKRLLEYFVFREVYLCIGRILVLAIVLFIAVFLPAELALMIGFGIAALASFLHMYF